MPIPQTFSISLSDLRNNRALGVSLPFNAKGVFKSVYDSKTQIKSNLLNLILTNQGERWFNPLFGANIKAYLFEQLTDATEEKIQENIESSVALYIPQISINEIVVEPEPDQNKLSIYINYTINISNEIDDVMINFE